MKPLMPAAVRQSPSVPLSSLLLRLIVGGVLFYAGFLKAVGPEAEFAAAIQAYNLIPLYAIHPIAMALPWLEMWTGIFLVAGFATRQVAVGSAILFALFIIVVGSALARGIDLATCGCFGSDLVPPRYTVILDAFLLAASVILVRLKPVKAYLALEP